MNASQFADAVIRFGEEVGVDLRGAAAFRAEGNELVAVYRDDSAVHRYPYEEVPA